MSVIIFILILGLLVFVHELGHFVVAKYFGIRVDEFGMGFPPRALKLFSRNGTDYTLNWIPFGGFVKIYGEDSLTSGELDRDYKRSLISKKWWQQVLVLIAGVTMNIILAWGLLSLSFMIGAPTPQSQVQNPERLTHVALTILGVQENSPAAQSGLKAGDKINRVTSTTGILSNASSDGFVSFIQNTKSGETVDITISRGKEVKTITVSPYQNSDNGKSTIGVSIDMVGMYRFGFFGSIWQGLQTTYHTTLGTVRAFAHLIGGKVGLNAVTGPVGLISVVGDAEKIGFSYLMILTAIISINLAVINMVPFPALDGGRILFVIIEKIIKRPLPQKAVVWANGIGFALLILFMVVVTVKDVIKLF